MNRVSNALWPLIVAVAVVWSIGRPASTAAQEATSSKAVEVVGHAAAHSAEAASFTFDLGSGERIQIALEHGVLFVNGNEIAGYEVGGSLDQALRALATQLASVSTAEAVDAVRGLEHVDVAATEVAARAAVLAAVAGLAATEALIPDAAELPRAIVAAPREPRPAAAPRPTPTPRPRNRVSGGEFRVEVSRPSLVGEVAGAAVNLAAVFLGMSFMGLGLLIFAPRQLEVVADTVWHSFGRSFLAGLFAQPLLVPLFGTIIVALALTVVGILVIPFAVLAFLAAFVLAAVGGFLAVARTVGEIYLRRKMATGEAVATWGSYRYILYGLMGLSAIWLPAVLLGWVPVAGTVLTGSAALITWVLATAGFGATILSHAGVRGTFVRKLDLALTDEQYWTEDDMPTPYRTRSPRHR